jgi:hypothetical protein
MRPSVRIGGAALLITAIFLLGRLFSAAHHAPRPRTFWTFNVGSRPDPAELASWKSRWPKEQTGVSGQHYDISPIVVPNDRIIVMAKLSTEDTNWVSADLTEYVAHPLYGGGFRVQWANPTV